MEFLGQMENRNMNYYVFFEKDSLVYYRYQEKIEDTEMIEDEVYKFVIPRTKVAKLDSKWNREIGYKKHFKEVWQKLLSRKHRDKLDNFVTLEVVPISIWEHVLTEFKNYK